MAMYGIVGGVVVHYLSFSPVWDDTNDVTATCIIDKHNTGCSYIIGIIPHRRE